METKYCIDFSEPMLFLAIHNGHNLADYVKEKISITDQMRIREEDPFTEGFVNDKKNHIIQLTSRFEYDLNRWKSRTVYKSPEDCWGLPIYASSELSISEKYLAENKFNTFYRVLNRIIEIFLEIHDKILIWDVHSYNHRRGGLNADFDPIIKNPEVILGTNNFQFMPETWKPFIDDIETFMKDQKFKGSFANRPQSRKGQGLDVRQNVKYPGGYLSQYLNNKYSGKVCCISIEFKKIWMNEWTQEVDNNCFDLLKSIFNKTCSQFYDKWVSLPRFDFNVRNTKKMNDDKIDNNSRIELYKSLSDEFDMVLEKKHGIYKRQIDFFRDKNIKISAFLPYYKRYKLTGDLNELLKKNRGFFVGKKKISKIINDEYISQMKELIKEYELIKKNKHPRYQTVAHFLKDNDLYRDVFLKNYENYKNTGDEKFLVPIFSNRFQDSFNISLSVRKKIVELLDKKRRISSIYYELVSSQLENVPSLSTVYRFSKAYKKGLAFSVEGLYDDDSSFENQHLLKED